MKDIFLKLMLNTQNNYMNFIMAYHFNLTERNLKKKFTSIKSWINFDKKLIE